MLIDPRERSEPPRDGSEAATLAGFLDYQRETLRRKCHGLGDEQLRMPLPPSPITLGGLLKHLACVEDSWFTEVVAGQPLPEPWASVDFAADPDWTWNSAAADSGDTLRSLWAERVNRSRGIVEARIREIGDSALSRTHRGCRTTRDLDLSRCPRGWRVVPGMRLLTWENGVYGV